MDALHFVAVYSTAGLCLLMALAFTLRRAPNQDFVKWVSVVSAFLFLVLVPTRPWLDDDLNRYVWDGRVTWERGHPYGIAPSDYRLIHLRDDHFREISFRDTPTVYPPVAELLFAAAAPFGSRAPWIIKLFLFAAHLTLLWMIPRVLATRRTHPAWFLLYAFNPVLFKEFANSGHVDLAGAALLFAGLTLAKRRWVRVVFVLLAAGIKPIALLAIPVVAGWVPLLVLLAGGAALTFAVPNLSSGATSFATHWVFFPFLFEPMQWIGSHLGASPSLARLLAWIPPLVVLWRKREWEPVALTWLAFSPVVNPWYLVWLLPFWVIHGKAYGALASSFIPLSYLFYVDRSDPFAVRWVTYGLLAAKFFAEKKQENK